MSEVQAILFDLGGVVLEPITDGEAMSINADFGRLCKDKSEKEIETVVGKYIDEACTGKITMEQFYRGISEGLGIPIEDVRSLWYDYLQRTERPNQEVVSQMQKLQNKGIRLAYFSDIDAEDLGQLLPKIGVKFETGVASNELGEYKMASHAGINLACQKLGLSHEQILYVDDKQKNVDKGRAQGVDSVRFENPAQLTQELRARGIDLSTRPTKMRETG